MTDPIGYALDQTRKPGVEPRIRVYVMGSLIALGEDETEVFERFEATWNEQRDALVEVPNFDGWDGVA